jgi:hypothetical protein
MRISDRCKLELAQQIELRDTIKNTDMPLSAKKEVYGRLMMDKTKVKTLSERLANNISTFIVHGYLLNTKQLIANIGSAAIQGVLTPLTREAGTLVAKMTGTPTPRKLGEGIAMMRSYFDNFSGRMAVAGQAFASGHSRNDKLMGRLFGMREDEVKQYIKQLNLSGQDELAFRQNLTEIYGNHVLPGTFGKLYSTGARAGVALDDFNQIMFKQGELSALAYRAAPDVAKRENISEDAAYNSLMKSVDFTKENYDGTLRVALQRMGYDSPSLAAKELENSAAEAVFRGEAGKTLELVMKLRSEHPLLGAFVLPFVKTPSLIVNESIAWVPIAGFLNRKAKYNSSTGAFEGTDFAARLPERRADLIAKQMMGTAAVAYIGNMYNEGLITGSNPQGGAPQYSVKMGDTWYSYARFEPVATVLGFGADFWQIVNEYKKDPKAGKELTKDIEQYGLMFMSSFAQNVTSKSFFHGLGGLFGAIESPETNMKSFFASFANALVPSGAAQVAQAIDPVEREFTTFMERVIRRVPGMSQTLPAKSDILGQPMEKSLTEIVTGVKVKTPNNLTAELEKYDVQFAPPDRKLFGVEMNTEQAAMQRRLAGAYFANQIENIMKSNDWGKQSASIQEFVIRQALNSSRSAANREVTGYYYINDPKFREEFTNNKMMQKGYRDALLEQQGRQAPQQVQQYQGQ